MRSPGHLPAGVLALLIGCASPPDLPVIVTGGNGFFGDPWPNDLRTNSGRPDMDGFPGTDEFDIVQTYVDGIENLNGFGTNAALFVRFDRAIPDGELPDPNLMFNARYFDNFIASHASDAPLVISLAGVPEDIDKSKSVTDSREFVLAVFMREVEIARALCDDGRIDMAVVPNVKKAVRLDQIPTDMEKAFALQYEFITSGQ